MWIIALLIIITIFYMSMLDVAARADEEAELENRKWICIEKEQEYCDITIKRLQELHNNQI